jgi:hypothetical protein
MLGLILSERFQGRRLGGAAIERVKRNPAGARQAAAGEFIRITRPFHDVSGVSKAVTRPRHVRPLELSAGTGPLLMAALIHTHTRMHASAGKAPSSGMALDAAPQGRPRRVVPCKPKAQAGHRALPHYGLSPLQIALSLREASRKTGMEN